MYTYVYEKMKCMTTFLAQAWNVWETSLFQIPLPFQKRNVKIQESKTLGIINVLLQNWNHSSPLSFIWEAQLWIIFFFFNFTCLASGVVLQSWYFVKTFPKLWKLFDIWLRSPPCFSGAGPIQSTPISYETETAFQKKINAREF